MCEGQLPPFTLRFGDFKRIWHQKKGVPEPPNILLVMDFSNYVSADEFGDPDFDEDLMLNQIQLMSLHSHENLLYSTVEDLKLAALSLAYDNLHMSSGTRGLGPSASPDLRCSSEHAASAAIRVG